MKEELKSFSLEELRYRDMQGTTSTLVTNGNKESLKRHLSLCERQLEILDILLKSSCVRSTVNYLVCTHVCAMHAIGRPVRATVTLYSVGRPVRATITLYPIGSYDYTVFYRETC